MRWFNFAILVVFILIIQVGLSFMLGLGPQRVMPDLFLLLMILLAFRGRGDEVLIAGWILGLVKDLSSQAPLGSYAITFGLFAWMIMHIRDLFYGERTLALMPITFLCSVIIEHMVWLICLVKGGFRGNSYGGMALAILFSAALTAALMPYGQWLLVRFHKLLGLPSRRIYGK